MSILRKELQNAFSSHRLVGKTTDNDALILDAKLTNEGRHFIVLCYWHLKNQFVVWRMRPDRSCYWGRYVKTLRSAVDIFDSIKD